MPAAARCGAARRSRLIRQNDSESLEPLKQVSDSRAGNKSPGNMSEGLETSLEWANWPA